MSFSAKRWAYCPRPSFSSQSAICCIAATKRISHCQRFWIGGTQSLSYQIEERVLAGLIFLLAFSPSPTR
jgi:hypothetical protein